MSLKPMLHLRMVRTRVRDSYSAKPCPLIQYRSCSFAFRTRNSLRDKKLHGGKSVWVKNGFFGSSPRSCFTQKRKSLKTVAESVRAIKSGHTLAWPQSD